MRRRRGTAARVRDGNASNPLLLWGIASELAFAAALIYVPPLQRLFGSAALRATDVALLLTFPVVVWGADELRRARLRRRDRSRS